MRWARRRAQRRAWFFGFGPALVPCLQPRRPQPPAAGPGLRDPAPASGPRYSRPTSVSNVASGGQAKRTGV
ncbi:hypothetical protein ACVILE_003149 [Streptomyces sp. M18.1]